MATDNKAFATMAHQYYSNRFDARIDDFLYFCKRHGLHEAPTLLSLDPVHCCSLATLKPKAPGEVELVHLPGVSALSQLPRLLQEPVPLEVARERLRSQQPLA
jgi:hypothetical protein